MELGTPLNIKYLEPFFDKKSMGEVSKAVRILNLKILTIASRPKLTPADANKIATQIQERCHSIYLEIRDSQRGTKAQFAFVVDIWLWCNTEYKR